MVSRKTMFGIGLPKDPTDPSSKADPADQSSPTVVDDDKVAEGLKQLRSWYQEASNEDDTRRVVVPAVQPLPAQPLPAQPLPAASAGPHARPTAVGHATGEAPPQTQRPVAADPMRATMFGHDLHRLDFEGPLSGLDSQLGAPPSPVAAPRVPEQSPRPRNAAPGEEAESLPQTEAPTQEYLRRMAEPIPETAAPMPEFLRRMADLPPKGSGSFRVSSLDNTDTHQAPRVPLMARLVLVTGVAALTVAALLWMQSRSSDAPTALPSDVAPPPSLPAPPIGTARTALPVAGNSTEAPPIAPAQSVKSTPAPAAPAPTVAPKTARPTPVVARPAPRRKPRIPEAEASDSDDLASAPPAAETVPSPLGTPPQGKDLSPPEQTAPVEREVPVRKKADGARQPPAARPRFRDADATMPPSIE